MLASPSRKSAVRASSSTSSKPYKILSLDGGGSWALIQAKVLNDLYPGMSGHEILNEFDLVAANSGGSLVLGGLVADMKLDDIALVFRTEQFRRRMFHGRSSLAVINRMHNALSLPRYSTEDKLAAIEDIFDKNAKATGATLKFSDECIQGINTRLGFAADLLIAAFDYDRQRSKLFRSNLVSDAGAGGDQKKYCRLVEAMNASTNAPIRFFDKPAIVNWKISDDTGNQTSGDKIDRFWDGAVAGCNNPVLMAVTEALANGINPADIIALSIGTGTARLPLASDFSGSEKLAHAHLTTGEEAPSMLADIMKMSTTILSDPPDSASYIAHTILANGDKGRQRLVRMSPFIRPLIGNDGTLRPPCGLEKQFREVCVLEMDAVKQKDVELIFNVTENWMNNDKCDDCVDAGVVNQPIRYSGRAFEKCVIGHSTYAEAKKHWLGISK